MKKYFVIGNPINHSLSPKLHNHWLEQNNIILNKIILMEFMKKLNLKKMKLKVSFLK